MKRTEQKTLTVDLDTHRLMTQLADEAGQTLSGLVRVLVRQEKERRDTLMRSAPVYDCQQERVS